MQGVNMGTIYVVTGFFPMNTAEKVLRDYVTSVLHAEPESDESFLFCNKAKKEVNVLVWDGSSATRIYPTKKISWGPEQKGTIREISDDEHRHLFGIMAELAKIIEQSIAELKQSLEESS
jgi:hypothetical protein